MLDEYASINGNAVKNSQFEVTTFTIMKGKFLSQPFANIIGFFPNCLMRKFKHAQSRYSLHIRPGVELI